MKFAQAAFTAAEIVCIPDPQPDAGKEFWAELSRPIFRALGYQPTQKQLMAIDAPEDARLWMREVLSSGGGLVLVRSAERFPRACEIIDGAGGSVGFRAERVAGLAA